ncbi:MAG: hypothetical protein K4571_17745 [Deltaproteobacteria bacterium]
MKIFIPTTAVFRSSLMTGLFLILLAVAPGGYAMQPPPPPLDIDQFRTLIAKADLIVVGTVEEAQETEETVAAVLRIEKLLKGKRAGKTIAIREIRGPATARQSEAVSKDENESSRTVVAQRAGPVYYHGRYKPGLRIVVLLEAIQGTAEYRPLGSGTYTKHLCVFPVESQGMETFYFKFAENMKRYAGGEKQFVCLIRKVIKMEARFEREVGRCTRD